MLLLIPVYVLAFSGALARAAARVFSRRPGVLRVLLWLPVLAGVSNLVEDGLVWALLSTYPERHDALAAFAGSVTGVKTSFIAACLLGAAALHLTVGLSRAAFHAGLRSCHI